MKTNFKIKYMLFFAVFLSLIVLTLSAWAEENGKINFSYVTNDVEFNAYRVGNINVDGSFALNEAFAAYPVSLTDTLAAQTLAYYAARDGISPMLSVKTNSENIAVFDGLEKGIYLITGETVTRDKTKYTALPVLAAVNGGSVEIKGKYEFENETDIQGGNPNGGNTDTSSTDTPDNSKTDTSSTGTETNTGGGSSSFSASTVGISVIKVWKGESGEQVTAQLLKDGQVYDEVDLNSTNNWRYTWKSLSRSYTWTVVEKEVPNGYTVGIEKNGNVFVITNTNEEYISEEPTITENNENPNTSDNSGITDNPNTSDNNDNSYNEDKSDNTENDSELSEDTSDIVNNDVSLEENNTSSLPQTGQLWWPVVILACLGVLCLIIGEGRRRVNK